MSLYIHLCLFIITFYKNLVMAPSDWGGGGGGGGGGDLQTKQNYFLGEIMKHVYVHCLSLFDASVSGGVNLLQYKD